jgi:tetratricopeptide (TPR) repeat protein
MGSVYAHGDLHEQIERITKKIEQDPGNVQLYLERGQLYLSHKEEKNAIADFDKVISLDDEMFAAYLLKSQAYLSLKDYDKAMKWVNIFLSFQPKYFDAFHTRAQIHLLKDEYEAAAMDFDKVIQYSKYDRPLQFIEAADAWSDAGKSDLAVDRLQTGIERMGFLITFYDRLVKEYYLMNDYQSALNTINTILNKLPTNEKWMLEKGKTEVLLGRKEDARRSFETTLYLIGKLPPNLKNTKAMVKIKNEALAALESLKMNIGN